MLTTERLVLRKPTLDDVEPAAQMLRDPQVMRWLGGVEDDPAATVRRWIEDWDRYPAGKFVVVLPNGTFVGRVGLNFFDTATWTRSTAKWPTPFAAQRSSAFATASSVPARSVVLPSPMKRIVSASE